MKFEQAMKPKIIYVFRINDEAHKGCLKVGEATIESAELYQLGPNASALNKAAKKRINQYTQTAGIAYDLLYTEVSFYISDKGFACFTDSEVHRVLQRSGISKKVFDTKRKANEWFITDLETVKKAISAVKEGKDSLNPSEVSQDKDPIVFRPEQKEAIEKTKKQFKKGNEMLWNAKMRFGKTLSALQVVKEHSFKRSLILTHRPVVDNGWFEDFGKIFYDRKEYFYGSKSKGGSFSNLEEMCSSKKGNYIYFASMQDLRGSEMVGGNFDKNDKVFSAKWDLIIIDEAHEGTQTELGANVISALKEDDTKILHLSGTPFNLIDSYKDEEIFTWDYTMEQRAKAEWDELHFGDPNPYASLPKLNIFTYDLGKIVKGFVDEEVAFNFREFFRVDESEKFLHESDVKFFLDLMCTQSDNSNYPFTTKEYRDNFRHSLWMVPGVKEAKALSALLKSHQIFGQFEVVNVAGEGDEEEENLEALSLVEKAIGKNPHETYTITISCGRLTTGVSVKPWTAVFMLSGSHNTAASTYMQTIFRVQTPATINGRVKEECFVFDFAPDRTLKVIAEAAKISARAGETTAENRKVMGEFLNFCPIIAVEGSQMKDYDVNGMLEQLKRVYIERVVNNGFEDTHLYNKDQLMNLDELEIDQFNGLRSVIGSTKAIPKSKDIDVNNQGFTDEEYEELDQIKKKPKKELSDKDKELLDKHKELKKMRDTAIAILRGISIRMPLMIYGADVSNEEEEITIDNFTELVDDQSWIEFMPVGVTKRTFLKFKKYYDPDVFRAAGKKIRALAYAADSLTIEERIDRITSIFGTFRNPDKETVLTPWKVVNMHLGDCLGGYSFLNENRDGTISNPVYASENEAAYDVFNTDSRILDINSKSGLYPLYVAYNIFRQRVKENYPNKQLENLTIEEQIELWDKSVAENIFILCKTPMAKSISKRTLVGFRKAKVNTHHFEDMIYQINERGDKFVKKIRRGESYWKAIKDNDMKFDAIIGNPPYMEMDGGAQASAKPIYNQFVDIAKKIEPRYISMIMPARWYAGGRGLDQFRDDMLDDKRISVLHDFLNPEQVFPNTNIRGGLCYFLWQEDYDNTEGLTKVVTHSSGKQPSIALRRLRTEGMDTFIRHNSAVSILMKTSSNSHNEYVSSHVSPLRPFGFRGYFVKDDRFNETEEGVENPIICYGKGKQIGYVERGIISVREDWIDSYKLFTSRANNIGTELNDDNLNTFLGEPGTICTESYMVIGAEIGLNEETALNFSTYLKTRFARFMHSLAKSSQDATAKTYKFVPMQDYTAKSDIDWSLSLKRIDDALYAKYNLTPQEIEFIEEMIKPMKN